MSLDIPAELVQRWMNGLLHGFVGAARPTMEVKIRRVYLQRGRKLPDGTFAPNAVDADGDWTSVLRAKTDWLPLHAVSRAAIEQSFDSNGIATCTLDVGNTAFVDTMGALGLYHAIDKGYLSPWRAYANSGRPDLGFERNSYGDMVATAAQIHVSQGYGDILIPTFTGLLDSVNGASKAGTLSLVARDFGQLLTDCRIFGWNKDPKHRPPTHFVGEEYLKKKEQSSDPDVRKDARNYRTYAVVCKDLSDMVSQTLTWSGLPRHVARKTGVSLSAPYIYGQSAYLIDVITKAKDVTGYTFFMGEPTEDYPMGRPTFKRSNIATMRETDVELKDEHLLTDVQWQRTDEPLAGIIRVRGKPTPRERGGVGAGEDHEPRVMAVYRPPWHVHERDARMLRHVVHYEDAFTTLQECMASAQMIALQEALAATTATVEIPAHPALQLDDIISIYDRPSGLSTRAWVASKQSTFVGGKNASWKQSLGMALADTPDVVQVVADLHETLIDFEAPPVVTVAPGSGELPPNMAEGEGQV